MCCTREPDITVQCFLMNSTHATPCKLPPHTGSKAKSLLELLQPLRNMSTHEALLMNKEIQVFEENLLRHINLDKYVLLCHCHTLLKAMCLLYFLNLLHVFSVIGCHIVKVLWPLQFSRENWKWALNIAEKACWLSTGSLIFEGFAKDGMNTSMRICLFTTYRREMEEVVSMKSLDGNSPLLNGHI